MYGSPEDLSKIIELENEKVDMVISIDSTHIFYNFTKFVEEVERILKPDGYFIISDIRETFLIDEMDRILKNSSMKIEAREDITPNVIRALKLDEDKRIKRLQD